MPQRLKFNRQIVSTAANPVPTKELLSRLNALHTELAELEQDNVDLISLESIKDDLINKKLLKNSNNGIQIYVACCLADILRLYAPDAPYNDSNLNSIFKLFLHQFDCLAHIESPYYENYVYLLERVAEVKLTALMTDLSNKDKLIYQLFETFYALPVNKSFDSANLEHLLIDILNEIISEVNHLELKVLKLILNKFLANSKNLKNQSQIRVPGFQISLSLCEINFDKLSRFITYFFSEMILEATKNVESDIASSDSDNSNNSDSDEEFSNNPIELQSKIDLVQMKKIHTLAIELWRYVPEILTSVLGLLDNELEADDVRIRIIATDTISKILSIQSSRINFVSSFVSTYMNWLKKPLDISVEVRITWINGLAPILESRSDINSDVVNGVLKTLIDSNDKVRLATIIEFSKLKPSTFLLNIVNPSLVSTLFKLLREKNSSIRNHIIHFLATLYNYSANNFDDINENNFTSKIPNNILNLIYINDNTINSEIDLALFEKIIPFNSDASQRVGRLLLTFSLLSERSQTSLFAIIKRQNQLSQVILHLLSLITGDTDDQESQTFDASEKEDQIINAIKWISTIFPSSYNADLYINHFIELNNKRFFKLLKLCVLGSSDYDTIVNSMKELLNRVKDPKFVNNEYEKNGLTPAGMYNTIKLLLLRSSNIFYNVNNISKFVEINTDESSEFNEISKLILNNVSQVSPNILADHIKLMCDSIIEQTNTIDLEGSRLSNDCWNELKTIFNYTNKNKSLRLVDKFYNILYDLAIRGTVLEAKYSIKIISNSTDAQKSRLFTGIVNKIWPLNINSSHFVTHLSSLATLFICDMISVSHIKEDLSKFLANEVLLKNHNPEVEADQSESEEIKKESSWITDAELYYNTDNKECLAKIITMKLLANWLINASDDLRADVEQLSKPILSMFSSFINRGGEIVSSGDTPPLFASRLRLHAGIQLLKVSQFSSYDKFIDQRRINRLILLIQDVEYEVRFRFLNKLKKKLSQNKISKRFLSLIFFTAHEPDHGLKSNIATWIRASFTKQALTSDIKNSSSFEKSYIRLLHMLSNHPELKELYNSYKSSSIETPSDATTLVNADEGDGSNNNDESEELKKFKELSDFALTYIVFSLSLIMTSENISLLYYLSQRIKQFKGIEPYDSDNACLYLITEFSQTAINYIGKIRNWNISIWPGKLTLPSDLFEKLDNETANQTVKTVFIPDEFSTPLLEIVRHKWRMEHGITNTRKNKKKQQVLQELPEINIQKPESSTTKSKPARKRKRASDKDKDEDSSNEYEGSKRGKEKERIFEKDSVSTRNMRRRIRVDYNELD